MKTQIVKFKRFSLDDLRDYLINNNLRQIINITDQIMCHIENDTEFFIMQEKLFEGYRVVPKWNLELKSSKLDGPWYNWYIKSNQFFPEDMFQAGPKIEDDVPWGMAALYMPWSLFRVSPELLELFNNVPRCSLHDFFEKYSRGLLEGESFNNNCEEWPLSLSIAMDDKSKISFFTPKKIYEMLKSDACGFTNYFDHSKSLMENMDDLSLRKQKATMTTFGRAIEKLCTRFRSWNRGFENQFEDAFMLNALDNLHVKLVEYSSKDIPWAYDGDSYYSNSDGHTPGSLGRSCMRSPDDQRKVAFYSKLGDSLKILVLEDEDSFVYGRALVWQNCYNRRRKDSFKVMDRVYTTENRYEILFHNYAKNNGIIRKKLNSYTNNALVKPDGKGGIGACFVQLPKSIKKSHDSDQKRNELPYDDRIHKKRQLYWPWLDTFKFYDPEANCLTTHKQLGGLYKAQSTSGTLGSQLYYNDGRVHEERTQKLIQIIESKNLELTC